MLAEGRQPVYASGECEIDLARQELRVQGSPVPVGGRAFKIIEILAQSAGQLVTKDELMDRIWPGAIVLENTLYVHTAAVRKALGPYRGLLKTESGRGYRLLGSWTVRHHPTAAPPSGPRPTQKLKKSPASNFPVPATGLVGRSVATQKLRDLASAYRVVTVTGPGGIGKTALALEVARTLLADFDDGGWLVELAPLSDPALVPSAVAGVLGLNLGGEEISAEAVARAVGAQQLLLVLDNCEHVIDAVANLAEMFVHSCPRTTILLTSREVLRVAGECVYRVSPLDVPVVKDEPDDILGRSAVELFVTRSKESDSEFTPRPEDLRSIAAICRHLDGIPLAIEFAAARTTAATGLRERFTLLTSGRRTAVPRHRTLRAALDWSYELLPEAERVVLRRLAIFAGSFKLQAASAVAADDDLAPSVVFDCVANLVDKSLATLGKSEGAIRWYLLETTRAYALEKLGESGERERVARRHAEFYLGLFAPFSTEHRLQAAIDDLGFYRRDIDNLHAALNWAFSPEGDSALGVALAATAADFWVAVSQLAEASEWAGKALALIGQDAGSHREMVLQYNLGITLIYTRGMAASRREMLLRALALALELQDFDYQQRAFHSLWQFSVRSMAINDALVQARQYEEIAGGRDPHSQATADWMIGTTQFYLAEHNEARMRLRRAIDQYPIESRDRDMIRFVSDHRGSAFGHLSASLLLLGLLDTASHLAANAAEEARGTSHPITLCTALSRAAGVVFLSLGDLKMAERYGEELIAHAYKHALRPFHAVGLCVRGSLAARRGDHESGLDPLRRGLTEMEEVSYLMFYPFFKVEPAAALGAMGRVDDGLAEIDGAMRFAEETDYRCLVPEILRSKGELLALRDAEDPAIEDIFRRSIRQARDQQALFWELRAATSLARRRSDQGRPGDALASLKPVYERFTEGFDAADLKSARALLDTLR